MMFLQASTIEWKTVMKTERGDFEAFCVLVYCRVEECSRKTSEKEDSKIFQVFNDAASSGGL